jgi:hypothetical protein
MVIDEMPLGGTGGGVSWIGGISLKKRLSACWRPGFSACPDNREYPAQNIAYRAGQNNKILWKKPF